MDKQPVFQRSAPADLWRHTLSQIPSIFGVFYYRSANAKTCGLLSKFFPVPLAELKRDFDSGLPPEEICARSVHALLQRGVKNVYISNLPMDMAAKKLSGIETRVEEMLVAR